MPISFIIKETTPVSFAGLYRAPDAAPHTSGSMSPDPNIIDDNRLTRSNTGYFQANESVGVQLEAAVEVSEIVIEGDTNGTTEHTSYFSTSHDSVSVYKSNNGSDWTFVEQFDAPPFTAVSGFIPVDITLTLTTPATAQYWKVVAVDSIAWNPGGASWRVTNIKLS